MKIQLVLSVLGAVVLLTCSVWTVQGRNLDFGLDDLDDFETEMSADDEMLQQQQKLPGLCWACKWALNKVKKITFRNATAEQVTSKLISVCDNIGFLKSLCKEFVKKHIGVLVEELSTTDDVRTICVNVKACKPKELLDLSYG